MYDLLNISRKQSLWLEGIKTRPSFSLIPLRCDKNKQLPFYTRHQVWTENPGNWYLGHAIFYMAHSWLLYNVLTVVTRVRFFNRVVCRQTNRVFVKTTNYGGCFYYTTIVIRDIIIMKKLKHIFSYPCNVCKFGCLFISPILVAKLWQS